MSVFEMRLASADGTLHATIGAYEAEDEATAVAEVLELHAACDPIIESVAEMPA